MLSIINEGSTAYLTVSFKTKTGALQAPTGASYRIDCLTNGQQVRDDTAITAGSQVEITLTPTDNAIIDQTKALEKKRVTVTGDYGTGDSVKSQYDYWVKNLSQVPSPQ